MKALRQHLPRLAHWRTCSRALPPPFPLSQRRGRASANFLMPPAKTQGRNGPLRSAHKVRSISVPCADDGPYDFGGATGAYEEGDQSTRFLSREALLAAVVACWQTHYPAGRVLIEGEVRVIEPQPILAGPAEIMERRNTLHAECEALSAGSPARYLGKYRTDRADGRACLGQSAVRGARC